MLRLLYGACFHFCFVEFVFCLTVCFIAFALLLCLRRFFFSSFPGTNSRRLFVWSGCLWNMNEHACFFFSRVRKTSPNKMTSKQWRWDDDVDVGRGMTSKVTSFPSFRIASAWKLQILKIANASAMIYPYCAWIIRRSLVCNWSALSLFECDPDGERTEND